MNSSVLANGLMTDHFGYGQHRSRLCMNYDYYRTRLKTTRLTWRGILESIPKSGKIGISFACSTRATRQVRFQI
jgi:hypothetical protein